MLPSYKPRFSIRRWYRSCGAPGRLCWLLLWIRHLIAKSRNVDPLESGSHAATARQHGCLTPKRFALSYRLRSTSFSLVAHDEIPDPPERGRITASRWKMLPAALPGSAPQTRAAMPVYRLPDGDRPGDA